MNRSHSMSLRVAVCAASMLLISGLTACAPEPGTEETVPSEVAGQGGKDADSTPDESSWGQPTDGVDVEQRNTELSATFPKDVFPIPESAEIYDTGERGEGVWYLLLLAPDETGSATLWSEVIQLGGFTVTDETTTPEAGQSATLTNASLRVIAVTLPQADGTVQLSYDIRQIG